MNKHSIQILVNTKDIQAERWSFINKYHITSSFYKGYIAALPRKPTKEKEDSVHEDSVHSDIEEVRD